MSLETQMSEIKLRQALLQRIDVKKKTKNTFKINFMEIP